MDKKNIYKVLTAVVTTCLLSACTQKTVEERMSAAEAALANNNYKNAIIQLKAAVQQSPTDTRPRIELARIYFDIGDMVSAVTTFDKVLSQRSDINDFAEPYFLALYSMADLDIFQATFEEFEPQLKGEQRASVEVIAAVIAARAKSAELAKQYINNAKASASDATRKRIEDFEFIINNFLLSNNVEQKDALYALTENYPNDWLARSLTAEIQQAIGDYDLAAENYQALLALKPFFAQLNLKIAEVRLKAREYSKAEPYIDRILSFAPEHPLANQQKAIVALSRDDFEAAARHIDISLSKNLITPSAIYIAGIAHFQIGNYEQSLSYLEKIVDKLPKGHPGLQMYIAAKLTAGDSLSAYELYEKHPALISSNNRLATKAASALLFSGHTNQAAVILDNVDDSSFMTSEEKQQLGLLKMAIGDSSALSIIESSSAKIVQESADGSDYKSKLLLIGIKTSDGEFDEARNIISEWIASAPDEVDNYKISAEFEKFVGNNEVLESIYTTIKRLDPASLDAAKFFAEKATENGDYDKAVKAYLTILRQAPNDEVALTGAFIAANNSQAPSDAKAQIREVLTNSEKTSIFTEFYVAYLAEDYNEVVSLSRSSIFDFADRPKVSYITARAFLELDQPLAAVEVLRRSVNTGFATVQIYEAYVEATMKADDDKKALRTLRTAPSKILNHPRIRLLEAHLLVNLKEYDKALAVLSSLPPAYAESQNGKEILGRAQAGKADFVNAIPALREAYESSKTPRSAQLLYKALAANGNIEDGLAVLEETAARTPGYDNADLFYVSELAKVDKVKAIAIYHDLLEEHPRNWQAMNNIAWLLLQTDQLDEANRWIMNALSLQPSSKALLDTKSQIESAISSSR
ncbi:XrtA/PEP-CTERM system TPR-repeat protein PrsT [Alteromonas sp. C1M14]|uniref:XrtA/PEP-CTERM system TPR-repeat protein PrsT n=1 Tax=Alteromonas sp. C1M14 TaxID=2841567 RepID=UPI001C0A1F24|nr:XrtA/PEP-CTERM system TPR-repeat protein PrsT [Alteromonas sp. C1M14]MBU2979196.1 PEP-CTERM system TPR-repeat protein PrsT [Alteromonas sp. C1M14]